MMKRKYSLLGRVQQRLGITAGRTLIVTAMAIAPVMTTHAEALLSSADVTVEQNKLLSVLQANMPEGYYKELLTSPDRLERQARDMHMVLVMANRAKQAGLDQDVLKAAQLEYMQEKFLAQVYAEHYLEQSGKVDYEKIAKENYLLNRKKFVAKESVRAEHILISSKERDEDAAKELAEEVYAKANTKQYRDKFTDLAVEFSEDPSVETNKGDLGFFTRGRMVPEFEQAAFGLKKKGELAGPVKTSYGYHIIRLLEHKPERQLSFDEVKEKLLADAEKTHKQKLQKELVESIMADPTIQVNLEAIEKLAQ